MNPKESDVIELLNHISEQEKHFNGLETQYRLLASTWLLASLGAIGFLLKSETGLSLDQNKLLLIGAIGCVSSIGIILLWILDIKVYHKLLNSVFIRGVLMEIEYPWLPKIRTDMLLSQDTGDVTRNTSLYYVFSTAFLQIIAIASFVAFYGFNVKGLMIVVAGALVIFLILNYMLQSNTNERTKKIYRKLKEHYVDDVDELLKDRTI